MAALYPNNPDHTKPLILYPDGFVAGCDILENCLMIAMLPLGVLNGLLSDVPLINSKYSRAVSKGFVEKHHLTEVEAKCVIMFTHESDSTDHPAPLDPTRPKRDNQLYFLFNKACRERDAAALQRFHDFSFHFTSALQKLPNFQLPPGQNLYRGFGQRLEDMNDLYQKDSHVWWYYTSSSSLHREVAYRDFARKAGTLMEISCHNAKDIQELSMIPPEGELLFPPNIEFKVKLALSCNDARLLNARYAAIPDNVDLVILEAAPHLPRPTGHLVVPVVHTGSAASAAV
jgi:hypothetical protein